MQNSMVVFIFTVLDRKHTFLVNLVQKIKIVSLSWNLVPRLIRICRIQWWCSFCFRPETHFLGKFGPKNQNCQFKLKFGTYTISNMQNSLVVFIFSVLYGKHSFWADLVQKIKIVNLSWNLISRLIRIWIIQWQCSLFLL